MSDQPQMDFQASLAARAREVETVLADLLDTRAETGEITRPERLLAAMRHGVLNGGKRLRPFLVVETTALFTRSADLLDAARRVGAALECIHC